MIRRSTWMLLLAFAVLAGLTWWARQQKESIETTTTPQATATPQPRLLPDLEPNTVVRIILEEPATHRRVVLERVDATPTPPPEDDQATTPAPAEPQWVVKEPSDAEAPEAWRVNSALEGLVYARIQATLSPDTDPATVGLAGPAQRIVLVTRSGDEIALWIGASTPLQNGYYLRVEDRDDLVAVSQYGVQSLWDLLNEIHPPGTPTPTPTP